MTGVPGRARNLEPDPSFRVRYEALADTAVEFNLPVYAGPHTLEAPPLWADFPDDIPVMVMLATHGAPRATSHRRWRMWVQAEALRPFVLLRTVAAEVWGAHVLGGISPEICRRRFSLPALCVLSRVVAHSGWSLGALNEAVEASKTLPEAVLRQETLWKALWCTYGADILRDLGVPAEELAR